MSKYKDLSGRISRNLLFKYVWQVAQAAAASAAVLLISLAVARISGGGNVSLEPPTILTPTSLLRWVLAWVGAIGAGATFVVVTLYQFAVLVASLRRGFSADVTAAGKTGGSR